MSRCPACGSETVGARCVVCGAPSLDGPDGETVASPWMSAGGAPTQAGHPLTPLYPDVGRPPTGWAPQPPSPPPYPTVARLEPKGPSVAGGVAIGVGVGLALLGLVGGALALTGRLPVPVPATGTGTPGAATAGAATVPATLSPATRPAAPAGSTNPVLTDLQPGVGLRLHQVQVTAPATLPAGRSVVVWISAEHGGAPNRPHTYPYAVVGAGEVRTVALHLGNEGGGDVGARYVVEACLAGGSTLTLVNGYLRELAEHGPAEEAFRAEGIAVASAGGDYTCPASAALVLTRTT